MLLATALQMISFLPNNLLKRLDHFRFYPLTVNLFSHLWYFSQQNQHRICNSCFAVFLREIIYPMFSVVFMIRLERES